MKPLAPKLYPWQKPLWDHLSHRRLNNQWPHALLIDSAPGLGAHAFAYFLAQSILCQDSQKKPCNECAHCHWWTQGNHPDCQTLGFLEEEKAIGIDDIRKVIQFTQLKPEGAYKVVLLDADKLQVAATQALLKSLEEPNTEVSFILTTEHAKTLLPTLFSRCLKVQIPSPTQAQSVHWLTAQGLSDEKAEWALKRMHGAPLRAFDFVKNDSLDEARLLADLEDLIKGTVDPINMADKWCKVSPTDTLYLVYSLLSDAICRLTSQPKVLDPQSDKLDALGAESLLAWVERWYEAMAAFKQKGLKPNYIMTDMLVDWQKSVQ